VHQYAQLVRDALAHRQPMEQKQKLDLSVFATALFSNQYNVNINLTTAAATAATTTNISKTVLT